MTSLELTILDLAFVIFLAGLASTIVAVGWRINRREILALRKDLHIAQKQLKELWVWLGGAETVEGDIGQIGETADRLDHFEDKMDDHHTDMYEEMQMIQNDLRRLIYKLDTIDSVKEFDGEQFQDDD